MQVILGSDQAGFNLKNSIKEYLISNNYDILDVTETPADDFVDSVDLMVKELNENEDSLAIAFDAYGAGSFIAASKHKGMIVAEISDEHSAYMTRQHNNARMITLGADIVGNGLAQNVVSEFLEATYDGGRHQARVDMLQEMC